MKRIISLALMLTCLSGCSVYKVLSQPGPVDLTSIGPGTSRQELLARFGAPAMVDYDPQGNKVDVFQFQSGFHQASKIRALPYLAADL
jgi:outer membrane protein assembly factor BamE (lipoprotein component of BamABCDE complex)